MESMNSIADPNNFSSLSVMNLLEGLLPVTDESTSEKETCCIFFHDLLSVLTSIGSYHPNLKKRTDELVKCIHLIVESLTDSNRSISEVIKQSNIELNVCNENNNFIRLIEQMKMIDDQIDMLMIQKKKLYQLFQNDSLNVEVIEDDCISKNIEESDIGPEGGTQHFSEDIIKQAMENQKKHLKVKTEQENINISNSNIDEGNIPDDDDYKFKCTSDVKLRNICKLNIINDNVTAMCVTEGRLFLGTMKGAIYFMTYDKMNKYEPTNICHSSSVSELLESGNHIVSSSYDGTVFLFGINKFAHIKKVSFKYGIHCMTELNGVLYLGSVNGYLFELNLRAFTQTNDKMVQVNSGFSIMKSGSCLGRYVLIILSIENEIIIRSISTGELLICASLGEPVYGLYTFYDDGLFNCFCLTADNFYILSEKNVNLTLGRIHNDGGNIMACDYKNVLVIKNTGAIQLFDFTALQHKCLQWNNSSKAVVLSATIWRNKLIMSVADTKNKLVILELPSE